MSKTPAEISVEDACDYIIVRLDGAATPLNVLKLHKLLYYVQAWHLAFFGAVLFQSGFQAWIHGPVSRPIYDRFRDLKTMYSQVTRRDMRPAFSMLSMPVASRRHIDNVLEAYAQYADTQLEEMTHREKPWQEARIGYEPNDRCEILIKNDTMRKTYAARLKK